MDSMDAIFTVILFALWCAMLTKVTADILATTTDQEYALLWILLVWTIPLLGLIAWAYFRGSRLQPPTDPANQHIEKKSRLWDSIFGWLIVVLVLTFISAGLWAVSAVAPT